MKNLQSYDEFVNEAKTHAHPDLTRVESGKKSIAAKFEPLVAKMEKMSTAEIVQAANDILDDPDTAASPEVRNKWKHAIEQKRSNKNQLMFLITNIVLGGANLKVN